MKTENHPNVEAFAFSIEHGSYILGQEYQRINSTKMPYT